MARVRIGRFAFAAATLAAFSVFLPLDSARAQAPAPPAGGQATVASSPASAQPAASASTSSSSPAAAPIAGTLPASTSHGVHTVSVSFDYDFSKTPACSARVTNHCVQQFIAYDISASAAHPTMLFPIPLPANPSGPVKGITRTSPALDFESGKHLISVSAMSPDGTHSKRSLCTTWITIP